MNARTARIAGSDDTWARYRSNLPRHLIGLSRFLQSETMAALGSRYGHTQLRLQFEPYISLIGEQGCRPGDLAQWLGISKQACNQTINRIEELGYIERAADDADRRATVIVLSARGRALRRDGMRAVRAAAARFDAHVPVAQQEAFAGLLLQLQQGLGLCVDADIVRRGETRLLLGSLLPRISDHAMHRLMELGRSHGHEGLKMSFAQVLSLIGPAGGRIRQMARIQRVSKQAISAIARDLESLGYLERHNDPDDARQTVLHFSAKGWSLIADSVAAVDELEADYARLIGAGGLRTLVRIAGNLYAALHLEEEIFEPAPDLRLLARQLKQQLGQRGAIELARLLDSSDTSGVEP